MQSPETVIHPENLRFCTPTHPFSLPSAEAPTRGSEPENQPTNPSCLHQPPAHDPPSVLSQPALSPRVFSTAAENSHIVLPRICMKYQNIFCRQRISNNVCITACRPQACIYVYTYLPTGAGCSMVRTMHAERIFLL